ncbi:MAG TPA: histidine kinase dimerization/phospho-acceptor domain-containing protein, partial [Ruminiclostridium sp.]
HELRTPLNIILGTIQITGLYMRNEELPINREKIISNINVEKQNCFRLLRLINNLIDSTKFDSGIYELYMENCNIVKIVEEITLSVADYMDSNQLSLVFDTDILNSRANYNKVIGSISIYSKRAFCFLVTSPTRN